jgi:NAD(P)-dependent dehydrogenase (short-subunit alcohol dehydrogenase family)
MVVVASRTPSTVDDVTSQIVDAGGEALGVVCDIATRGALEAVVARAVDTFGGVDILVNNAQGMGRPGDPNLVPLEEYPEERWDYVFDAGVKASFRAMQAVFPLMKERGGGSIINLGSPAAQRGREGLVAYNANKEAIRGLSRTAAREWGEHDIRVNVISPAVATETAKTFLTAEDNPQRRLADTPLQRFGQPLDAGRLAVFLAGDGSSFITGMTFMLDGGRHMFSL